MLRKVKNWKLAILSIIVITFLMRLGFWQLHRAEEKTHMLAAYHQRTNSQPLTTSQLNTPGDWQYYRTTLTGHFDNQHHLLLDNKIVKGQVGYEVFTPFIADGLANPILVDRGFIPAKGTRKQLPAIKNINGELTISGMVNHPPGYVKFGQLTYGNTSQWPMLIEFLNLEKTASLLDTTLFPYILNLEPDSTAAYAIEWQIVSMPPERHLGYAAQWFALALTLLILSVVLNYNRSR